MKTLKTVYSSTEPADKNVVLLQQTNGELLIKVFTSQGWQAIGNGAVPPLYTLELDMCDGGNFTQATVEAVKKFGEVLETQCIVDTPVYIQLKRDGELVDTVPGYVNVGIGKLIAIVAGVYVQVLNIDFSSGHIEGLSLSLQPTIMSRIHQVILKFGGNAGQANKDALLLHKALGGDISLFTAIIEDSSGTNRGIATCGCKYIDGLLNGGRGYYFDLKEFNHVKFYIKSDGTLSLPNPDIN